MAKLITHKFVSAIPDGTDATIVRPSNWNDTHDVTGVAESGANTDITSMTGITGGISSPDYIAFDTTYATPLTAGQLGWNGNDTLGLGMIGGNVVQHIGEDTFFYVKASATITKGQLCMFTGTVGSSGVLTAAPATAIPFAEAIIGVAAENIANNGFGLIQNVGTLRGVDTSAFLDGDILYYDSAVTGGFTNIFPASGPIVLAAAVGKSGSGGAGVLIVRISFQTRVNAGTGISVIQANDEVTVTNSNPNTYNPAAVAITGGTIDNTSIGATVPSTVNATTITGQTGQLNGTGTNLFLYSQEFDNASWSKANSSVTANTIIAPDGTLTADSFNGNGTGAHYLFRAVSLTQSVAYTMSCYVKQNNLALPQVWLRDFTEAGIASFDIVAGTVVSTTGIASNAQIVSVGNGWFRISAVFTPTIATANHNMSPVHIANSSLTTGFYVWGAQFEFGSTANTYIPTTTTAVYGTPTLSFSGVSSIGLLSNGALYLEPAGNGAIQADATTSTTVGGNARGANAVDWQTTRGGAGQVASGSNASILGGQNNTASGANASIAGGATNVASGLGSVVAGGGTNTSSGERASILGGQLNTAAGYFNFIGGGFTNSATANAAVTTQSGTMNATTAVTLSGSNANIKVGQLITGTSIASYTYVAAISGTSLTLSQNASGSSTSTLSFFTPHGVVVGGGNNQATGSYSFIGGGGDAGTAANRNVASGDWSFVGGGQANTASGVGAFIGGGGTTGSGAFANNSSGVASSILGGLGHTSSASGATVLGGYNNIANGARASVLGGRYGTTRAISGYVAIPASDAPIASLSGVSQSAILVLGRETTDATPTALCSTSSAAATGNQVILPNNSAYLFKATVISNVTGGGNTSAWKLEGAIKRGANAASTTIVGLVTTTLLAQDAGAATWAIAATADTTNGGLRITFTGQASTTIRTVCKVETTEVTF